MNDERHQKVTADHLKRDAYLYVRQSTLRQVFENTESTQRQYALRQRAVALGWPVERVVVIDSDLGQSGASAQDRVGFQKLVAEVSLGRAGVVLGLEVSRLARNNADWHRLLEICGLTQTLILDEDGLYDPSHFNDRLLLGLKGAMSEAELHVLKARLQGGIRNKAQRGELKIPLPVGLVYDEQDRVVLDPDRQVQQAIRCFFEVYRRIGSACGIVRHFQQEQLLFPRRLQRGPNKGQLLWGPLPHSRTLQILHNPRYAEAFVFGRTRTHKRPNGRDGLHTRPPDKWQTLLLDAHPGYLSWSQYQENQQHLRRYAQAHGLDRRAGPPGEGPALLQGLVLCGICGQRMTVRYYVRKGRACPVYVCQRDGIEHGQPICQSIPGLGLDHAVGERLLQMITPVNLQVAWAVQQELQHRLDETDQLRRQQIERVRYEAELAQHRYMQVDPSHRLVADELEAQWNQKLRELAMVQDQYEQQKQTDHLRLDQTLRDQVLALAQDLPALGKDPKTSDRDRKRIVRLLIEDVTLIKADTITVHLRFKGGHTQTLTLPRPLPATQTRKTRPQIVDRINQMLNEHTDTHVAALLNREGCRSSTGEAFTGRFVARLRRVYHLKSRSDRLRQAGLLTVSEMAQRLGVSVPTVKIWRRHGLVRGYPYNGKEEYLYERPEKHIPVKSQGKKLAERRSFGEFLPNRTDEVQHEA